MSVRAVSTIGLWLLACAVAVASPAEPLVRARVIPTPTPTPIPARSSRISPVGAQAATSEQLLRLGAATVLARPARVFSGRRSTGAASAANRHQEVAAVGVNLSYRSVLNYCNEHPPQLEHVSGRLTAGGTITARGACFGTARGAVEMVGRFAGGTVALPVRSWTDDTVVADVPSVAGGLDQRVQVRVGRPERPAFAKKVRTTPQETHVAWSEPLPMDFAATLETVRVPARYLQALACGRGDHPQDDQCAPLSPASCGWWCGIPAPTTWASHPRTGTDAGRDSWQLRLPLGWRFDHIAFYGASDADVLIDQTIDPSRVTWSISWRTLHWKTSEDYLEHGTQHGNRDVDHYTGTYVADVYATGPAGTLTE